VSDPHQHETWFGKEQAKACVEGLKRSGFTAYYADNREEAVQTVLDQVPPSASVGIGGSVTVRELGLPQSLRQAGHTVYDHWDTSLDTEGRERARDSQVLADVFLSSSNAVTQQGALVNVDGTGNRVAAMIFGPKTTILVVGYNKIVSGIPEAQERIRQYVAPVNYRRLNMNTPCQKGDCCSECGQSGPKACKVTTIIEAPPSGKKKFVVIVVGERLGY
jgi:L-lactate utilization protein LutB